VRELLGRIWTGALILSTVTVAYAAVEPLKPIQMDPKEPAISSNVTKLIEELHYSQPHLDNSLSSAILDRYLDTLDGNRMYFTATDIATFNRLRYELDDRTRSGELQPVFDMFNLFRKRAAERVDYAIKLLDTEPDFTVDESYRWDRSMLPWPASTAELDEVWRQNVKSDALRLILTGKTWQDATKTLKERYERSYKRVTQLTADDVFETYMNAVAHNMDPHSSYLSPRQSEEYRIQMSLSYDGIGASLQLEEDYVKVMAPPLLFQWYSVDQLDANTPILTIRLPAALAVQPNESVALCPPVTRTVRLTIWTTLRLLASRNMYCTMTRPLAAIVNR